MIAILGGTFDPIHKGHIHIATRVFQETHVEQIHFMPCSRPVHRNLPQATIEQRCQMIELEISGRPEFVLNRVEIDRGGPSYSIDSLRDLYRRGFNRLALILGSDSFAGFSAWKDPQEILKLANLFVCRRPGNDTTPAGFEEWQVESVEEFETRAAGAILMLDVDAPDCASRVLRRQIAHNEYTGNCLGSAVTHYIDQHGLYRSDLD